MQAGRFSIDFCIEIYTSILKGTGMFWHKCFEMMALDNHHVCSCPMATEVTCCLAE